MVESRVAAPGTGGLGELWSGRLVRLGPHKALRITTFLCGIECASVSVWPSGERQVVALRGEGRGAVQLTRPPGTPAADPAREECNG
ncbi:hypothetical protein E2C01_030847 [Portunus trituberculatus]|uniref:Uncharacterized protein n=1 Tax=Portunus trituberculatus TaxID=210409 RepID=A0A5B7EWY2_PORTR|nr:hypothetical protein [Portunus trituberculatus]